MRNQCEINAGLIPAVHRDLADLLVATGSYILQLAYPSTQEADKKPPTVTGDTPPTLDSAQLVGAAAHLGPL